MNHYPTREEVYEELCKRHTRKVQERLWNAKVAVAGLGGLGSTIAIALARVWVGKLHLIDFDQVDLSNLNRQQYRMSDLGMYKTEALKEQLLSINPYLDIRMDTVKVTEENVKQLFEEDEIICEAFDRPEAKAMLVNAFFEHYPNKRLVAGSGMAGYESSNTIQTRKVAKNFYLCGDGTTGIEVSNGLMAPRIGICASHEANMIVRLILGEDEV
ncbi:sulfur carrier protein ThiS adenylyltransferase ThiF [Anaerosporobacter sp.]|uniref:sulfur carrier protein ThiS adenylyltransferase ThiF n=1 Tax=Anaerosporobacter sp. TaxID=1872529 RepID=UPI00286F1274|nr:sulfur carrier protein ThiS adenylyltransferase ThiF [Anaerosporobacter sp.]